MQSMKYVATASDGIPLYYEGHGTGTPALVFVHGWSCDRGYWKRQLDYFAQRYQVVALDLAGHGESGSGRQAWTMPAFGEDVAAVVEKVGLKDAVLIGHSMGGDVIVEAARLMPDRIRGLVWVDTYRTLGKPRTEKEVEEFLAPFRVDFVETTRKLVREMFIPNSDPALVNHVVADMSAAPAEVALETLGKAISFDREILKGLRELKAPIVAINPDYRPTDVEALQRHGVKVVTMSRVGHFLMMEDPETFNRLLARVIEEFSETYVANIDPVTSRPA